jgi:hypothetical protein
VDIELTMLTLSKTPIDTVDLWIAKTGQEWGVLNVRSIIGFKEDLGSEYEASAEDYTCLPRMGGFEKLNAIM